jgi:large subunit ribosomal protein L19
MLASIRRGLATSARVRAAAAPSAPASTAAATPPPAPARGTAPYPFASGAHVDTAPRALPAGLKAGTGLMAYLRGALPAPEKKEMLRTLFARNGPQRLLPGSIVSVTSAHAPTQFTGVLIALRRRGPDTSIVLRNVVQRLGVEMQFFVCSPHVQRIDVLRRGGPGGKRQRGAKLYYLRHSAPKMSVMASRG